MQVNDFSGLTVTPTDIDGMIEYKNKAYIFFEIKYGKAELPTGQRLALERLARDTIKAGKKSIVFIGEHITKDTSKSIDVSQCKVRAYFYNNKWIDSKVDIRLGEAVKLYIDKIS